MCTSGSDVASACNLDTKISEFQTASFLGVICYFNILG